MKGFLNAIGDPVSKETMCCVGGKVKILNEIINHKVHKENYLPQTIPRTISLSFLNAFVYRISNLSYVCRSTVAVPKSVPQATHELFKKKF